MAATWQNLMSLGSWRTMADEDGHYAFTIAL